jgi:hypothetical protein
MRSLQMNKIALFYLILEHKYAKIGSSVRASAWASFAVVQQQIASVKGQVSLRAKLDIHAALRANICSG